MFGRATKAVWGAIAASATGTGSVYVMAPDGLDWWVYPLVIVINALVGYIAVYVPKNA